MHAQILHVLYRDLPWIYPVFFRCAWPDGVVCKSRTVQDCLVQTIPWRKRTTLVTQKELLLRRFPFSSGQLASKRFKQHLWPRTKEHSVNPNEAPCNANCVTFRAWGGNKWRTQYLDANLSRFSHLNTWSLINLALSTCCSSFWPIAWVVGSPGPCSLQALGFLCSVSAETSILCVWFWCPALHMGATEFSRPS